MKLELTVDGELLVNLFQPNGEGANIRIAERLSKHTLAASGELLDLWQKKMESMGLSEVYQSWLFQVMTSREQFRRIETCEDESRFPKNEIKDVLIRTAKNTEKRIVVGDFNATEINNNRDIQYVNKRVLSKEKRQQIKLQNIAEHYNNQLLLKNNIFDLFESPISVDVEQGSSSEMLARYLSEFYDSNLLIIQDLYLPSDTQNEENLKKYVLPYIDRESCEVILNMSTNNGKYKKKFEDNYGLKIKCIPPEKDKLHEGFIKTSKYRITIPYRLKIFGEKGKNNKDCISISRI